jgi:hypothetical protein
MAIIFINLYAYLTNFSKDIIFLMLIFSRNPLIKVITKVKSRSIFGFSRAGFSKLLLKLNNRKLKLNLFTICFLPLCSKKQQFFLAGLTLEHEVVTFFRTVENQ